MPGLNQASDGMIGCYAQIRAAQVRQREPFSADDQDCVSSNVVESDVLYRDIEGVEDKYAMGVIAGYVEAIAVYGNALNSNIGGSVGNIQNGSVGGLILLFDRTCPGDSYMRWQSHGGDNVYSAAGAYQSSLRCG